MSGDHQDQDARSRLLRHLGQPGAFGLVSALGCGRLSLGRTVNGATLGAGYAPMAAAEALVADGLACWSGAGRSRRLVLSGGGAAPDRALSSRLVSIDGEQRMVLVDERESPLLWLHRRMGKDGKPQISAAEFAAGERFRADLTLAQMLPRVTMNWDAAFSPDDRGPGGRDPGSASDAAMAARQRVRHACDRLGPELSGLAIDVCGFLKGLDLVERERGWAGSLGQDRAAAGVGRARLALRAWRACRAFAPFGLAGRRCEAASDAGRGGLTLSPRRRRARRP